MVVEGATAAEVLAGVRQNGAMFFEEFPQRVVNNIYFDTPSLRNYHQNVDGDRDRVKVRVRWYGPLFGHARKPVLELKRKQGLLGTKDSAVLPALEVHPRLSGAAILDWLKAAPLAPILRRDVEGVEPVLMNRYHRRYFRSADRRLRLTVDTGLEFYHIALHQHTVLHRARAKPFVIVEVKYEDEDHDLAAVAVNDLPFRLHRMSKYVLGMELLRG